MTGVELATAYISILPSTSELAPAIRRELGVIENEAGQSGEETGSKFSDGFGSMLKKAGGLMAGFAIGGGIADGIGQALDQGTMNAQLSASLGLTEAESARAGKVAGSLFSSNYGESMEDVNAGIKSVISNVDGMREASESSLTRISGKVLNTASVFDQDLGGVTRAVGQLMRTGLAKNADEALDIITVGFQKGADKSEDFLDTLNEYGTQFRKLGIDGKTATGLISQGLAAGARDGDLVADALKEFSIRAVDGSKASSEAFAAMGLDAGKMTTKIAKGGKFASAGLGEVLTGLRKMKDPVKREAAAVGIFGTQAEDLGEALFSLDPSKAAAGLGKVGGAAKKASDQMGDTPAAKWTTFTRTLQQGFVDVMGGKVIPLLDEAYTFLKDNKTILTVLAGVVVTAAGAYMTYQATVKTITAVTKGWAAATTILNTVMKLNPIGMVVTAIALLVAGFILAYKKSETFRNIVNGALNKVKGVAQSVANFFTDKVPAAFDKVKGAASKVLGWVKGNWPKILAVLTGPFGLAVYAVVKNFDKIKTAAGKVKTWVSDKFSDLVGFFKGLPSKISSATSGLFDGIKAAFKSAINFVIGGWNNLNFSIPEIKVMGKKVFGGASFGTPDIPMLAKGGLLNEPTLNVAGEAGPEAVVPLDRLEGWINRAASVGASSGRAAANPVASGSSRSEFVITNWTKGVGYFREIAEDTFAGESEFAGMVGRMR